jgi:hypothetical protein
MTVAKIRVRQMAVSENTSAPCGVDEVYQCFLTGRLVEYLDAKFSGTGGYDR